MFSGNDCKKCLLGGACCSGCRRRCVCGVYLKTGLLMCSACSTCDNCHRRCGHVENSTLSYYPTQVRRYPVSQRHKDAKRYKWGFCFLDLEDGQTSIGLCTECSVYLHAEGSQTECKPENVWPAFVWSVLLRKDTVDEAWSLLPAAWRIWWKEAFVLEHGLLEHAMLPDLPLFRDATEAYKMDTAALSSLVWTDLMSREESLVLPDVKCPAGCSEFKHKVNELPFDLVWEECLQVELKPIFSSNDDRRMTRFFRKDYLVEERIISNPRWICKASIAKTGDGAPSVLCCRHHSRLTNGQMIHCGKHPSGSLSSSKAGALSPVIAVPRSLQKARMCGYSASFQMGYLEGSFFGLDTMSLATHRDIASVNFPLAWDQDVHSYGCRKDVRAFIQRKYRDSWGFPGCIATKIDRESREIQPHVEELKEKFQYGATYVSIEDAINTQSEVDFASPELALIINEAGDIKEKQFRGAYPRRLVWAHPAASRLGCRPPSLPKFAATGTTEARMPWLLSSMLLLVPEVWQSVASYPMKSDWEWQGHMLTFLARRCLTHIRGNPSSNQPFTQNKKEEEMLAYFPTRPQFDINTLHTVFDSRREAYPGLQMAEGRLPEVIDDRVSVVIVTMDRRYHGMYKWVPPMKVDLDGRVWKLCHVGVTSPAPRTKTRNSWSGEVYSRHSSGDISHWWRTTRDKYLSTAVNASIIEVENMEWDVCVYVGMESYTRTSLRDKVLASCGGQSMIYCAHHDYPLITSTKTDKRLCFCKNSSKKDARCGLQSIYSCAVPSCTSAICRKHVRSAVETGVKFFVHGTCVDRVGDTDPVAGDYRMPFLEEVEAPKEGPANGNKDDEDAREMYTDFGSDDDGRGSDDDGVDIGEHDGDQFEAHFRLQENLDRARVEEALDDDFFAAATTQGTADMDDIAAWDLADVIAHEENDCGPTVPTTDAGTLPIWTLTQGDYQGATVNNHVLLNNFGHMLIRRNRKLSGTLNQKHFMQRLVSRMPGESLPLIYPEGMLFADIFYADTTNGSILGAIPSCMLNADRVLAELGFSTMEDHYRTRLSNPGLLTSSNPKYHFFAFDCMANLGLRGCDSRVVLRRGFAEHQGKGGVRFKGRDEPIFDTEHVDSRPIVNQLGAAIHEDPPTYFYTHTVNMKHHFGIKYIWDYISSDEVVENYIFPGSTRSDEEMLDLRKTIVDGAGVLLLRSWMEMMHIWIAYITQSPEQPIGDVTKFLFRMELQDARANLPHLHSMLWTTDDLTTEAGLEAAWDRIRGFIGDIIRPEERERYIRDGIFEDDEAVVRFMNMMSLILNHNHTRRCFVSKKRKHDDGEEDLAAADIKMRCKANMNFKDNPCPAMHVLKELEIEHSEEAQEILIELGCAERGEDGSFRPTARWLVPTKHYPPAHGDEGIISPVFGALAARNPNMMNAQFATGYTLARYLAKYIVMIDLYNTIRITPPVKKDDDKKESTDDKNTFTVEGKELPNQKITGNRMQQEKEKKKAPPNQKVPKHREGRAMNVVEFYMMLFKYDPIMTNIKFVKVETKGYDERPAQERQKPIDSFKKIKRLQHVALSSSNTIPLAIVHDTYNYPAWRRLSGAQQRTVFDDYQSPLGTSSVTRFSARPPELMFVTHQADYFRWFTSEPNTKKLDEKISWIESNSSSESVGGSLWVDGFTSQLQVRALAVPKVLAELRARKHGWFKGYDEMLELLEEISSAVDACTRSEAHESLLRAYVSDLEEDRLPVVWYESVRPTRTNRFLVHVLLSLGHMKTEYELFAQPSMRHSFIAAGLLNEDDKEGSARALSKRYVSEQLACLPSGTRTFDQYLKAAYTTIHSLFVHDRLETEDVPTVLYTHLKAETEDAIVQHQTDQKSTLVRFLLKTLDECEVPNLPTEEAVMGATMSSPCSWCPTDVPKGRDQPEGSHAEQRQILELSMNLVQHYKQMTTEFTKGVCQVGAGGVGKTTVLSMELLYALCQGLYVAITAMLSERAQELGGRHLHEIFCFPVNNKLSPGQLAERAISALFRQPAKLEFLRVIDVLGLDECGAIPCEVLAAMCHVLRYARDSNRPFGGVLVMATLDYLQIDPVKGRHPLMSPSFTTCLFFRELKLSVRAALDAGLQRIQAITRMDMVDLSDPRTRREWLYLLPRVCSFVNSVDKVPKNSVFVFGKKDPIKKEEKRILDRVRREADLFRISVADDEQRTIDGNFEPASAETSRSIDRNVKEPKELVFYFKGRYQITYNKHGKFSNSQLAMAMEVPAQQTLDSKTPVRMMVAPAGSRRIPNASVTVAELLEMGWREEMVGAPRRNDVQNASGSMRGKRNQYGMRHHVGSTIHGIMGQTLDTLVTRVEKGDKKHSYALWLAAQVVVLLSRTRRGKDTYFWIGNNDTPLDVAETLYDVLCQTSRFREHLCLLLRALCSCGASTDAFPYVVDHSTSIYRVKDNPIPAEKIGYVYLLISTRTVDDCYIGSAMDLIRRWKMHNTGLGALQTASERLRPWAILAYVVGFNSRKEEYEDFENLWIASKEDLKQRKGGRITVEEIHSLGKALVSTSNAEKPGREYRFVSTGTVERCRGKSNRDNL